MILTKIKTISTRTKATKIVTTAIKVIKGLKE